MKGFFLLIELIFFEVNYDQKEVFFLIIVNIRFDFLRERYFFLHLFFYIKFYFKICSFFLKFNFILLNKCFMIYNICYKQK